MSYLFLLLFSLQEYAAIIALGGAILVLLVVSFLIGTSIRKEDSHEAKDKVYNVRTKYFFGLIIILAVLLIITLRFLPYRNFQTKPDMVVSVVGRQWIWVMAPGVSDVNPKNFTGDNEITVPVNKTIRFIVTSADVNHDFAIYTDDGVLLAQTQAMPGYDNDLEYEFPHKGDYKILCLEYCGVAHPFMVGLIHVK